MNDWSSARYLAFEDERTRPARDLLAQVALAAPARVLDIGCGPGNSTALLVARWPGASVIGVDTSADMLAAARKRLPGVAFIAGDAAAWVPDAPVDVIFANAVLQWLDDPVAAMVRLSGLLAPGGVLAVQMPDNVGEPSHVLMGEAASAMPFAGRLAGAGRAPMPSVTAIWQALSPVTTRLDIWHTIYHHRLSGPDAIVDWFASTGLKPYLDRLDADEAAHFRAAYRERIAAAYPAVDDDGAVLLRFPRLFVVATR